MASFTSPTVYTTAEDYAVTDVNAVANNTVFLYQRPYISTYYPNLGQSLTSGNTAQINLTTTLESGYGFTLINKNVVVPLTGTYSVSGAVTLDSVAGNVATGMNAYIYQKGSLAKTGSTASTATSVPTSTVSGILSCTAGDTIGLWVLQSSGSSLFVNASGAPYTYLDVFFLGSQ